MFLTNDDGDLLVDDGDGNLENYYVLYDSVLEGSAEDLYDGFTSGYVIESDYDTLIGILENEGLDDEAEEVREAMEY